ncbi:MAG: MBL fold metallo-hydrolase [Alphaproteobacteria bacterium]
MTFAIKFWGVRGSVACPSPSHIGFGGNTSCVEIFTDTQTIIFDAGTGIRMLGLDLLERQITHANILLSHTHWDHINGFPFFSPAFVEGNHFTVRAGHIDVEDGGIKQVFAGQMAQPFFPVPLEAMRGTLHFENFKAGEQFQIEDITIKTAPLNHPNGATGYRVEYQGKSACYITDTEHTPGVLDKNILDLIQGADLVIYDSTYTEEEFPSKIGWGHSTWEQGIKLCEKAGAHMLAVFHHDPTHDDEFMEHLEEEVRRRWSGATVAREGMTLRLL